MKHNRRDFMRLLTSIGLCLPFWSPFLQGCNSEDNVFHEPTKRGHNKMGKAEFNKVIVLGMDGLDPKILESMMRRGLLPHFSRLAADGSYSRFATSIPPQSPVAWSSIATGSNP